MLDASCSVSVVMVEGVGSGGTEDTTTAASGGAGKVVIVQRVAQRE